MYVVLQSSSGFRNACVTETGTIGGRLLAVVTPKGVHPTQGTPSADLNNIYSAIENDATTSVVVQLVQSMKLQKTEKPERDER